MDVKSPVADVQGTRELLDEAERVLNSGPFHGSEGLRNLFSFLVRRSIDHPGEPAKEYEIAVAVLGRASGFDPRMDSTVRVHATRLRSKLAEYYVSEGADSRIRIEIQKGSYLVSWHYRNHQREPASAQVGEEPPLPRTAPLYRWKWFATGVVAAAITGSLFFATWRAFQAASMPAAKRVFWRPFRESPQNTLAVFSNPRLVGDSTKGLHYFREGIDSPTEINETYSGTGTVMAVYELTRLFSLFSRSIQPKRAELLTWDDVQNVNVVFVGGPESDTRLRDFPTLREFAFKSGHAEPRLGIGGIINLHPQKGEEAVYFSSGKPYTSDYAVIAMLPGLKPQSRVLLLAGTNTSGVQAAAEFTTREDLVADLLGRLGATERQPIPDFEGLLEVKVIGGVPVRSTLILLRRRKASAAQR